MSRFLFLLLLPFALLSCSGNGPAQQNTNESDPFREKVLRLQHSGFLKKFSARELDSLIPIYKKDSLNGLKEMLVKSGDIFTIDITLGNLAPHEKYAQMCKEVETHVPELASESVAFDYLPEDPGDKDTGWVLMTMRTKDQVYRNKLYFMKNYPIDETFGEIYNTRLSAENKDFRLYLVTFICTECTDPMNDSKIKTDFQRVGLFRMNKAQADSLQQMEGLALEPEDEFALLTPAAKVAFIKKFEASGILMKKDSSWYPYSRENIYNNTVYGEEHFYNFLDSVFFTANFDTVNPYNPYEDVLHGLAKISRGNFHPSGISDEIINQTVRTVRFTLNGKVYEADYEEHPGILDPSVIDNVNAALAEQKIPGAFYSVYTRGSICLVVYLPDANIEKAKASGLFSEFEKGASQVLKDMYSHSPAM